MNLPVRLLIVVPSILAARTALANPQPSGPLTAEQIRQIIDAARPGDKITFESAIENAEGLGAGLDASGDKVDIDKFKTDAPTATLGRDRAGAKGGTTDISLSVLGGSPMLPAWILCGLFAVGAMVCTYLRNARGALICGCGAGLALCAAVFPGLSVLVLAVAAAGIAFFFIKSDADKAKFKEALRAAVAGVAHAPEVVQDAVKREIAKHADDRDKATISTVKREDGL